MSVVRIAVVADVHHGADTGTKRGSAALPLLRRFVDEANGGGFDAVIDLGDRISDISPERDAELEAAVAAELGRLRPPRHHVSGNHDLAHLSLAENEALLGAPSGSRVVAIGGARVAFWQPDVRLTPERGFHLEPGDLDALAGLLDADEPTLLVSHVPLSGHAQAGNYYFENNPGHATYAEIGAIRRAIASAPCPVTALAGHVHWNTFTTVDGTPHLTLQSLTETYSAGGEPSGCTGVIEIEEDRLRWIVGGREPFRLEIERPRRKRVWPAPLGRFGNKWSAAGESSSA